jgi:Transposase, Mutator family
MTAPGSIGPARFLAEQLEQASPDLLRQMLKTFIDALMSAEADAVCGAEYAVRSANRINTGNGTVLPPRRSRCRAQRRARLVRCWTTLRRESARAVHDRADPPPQGGSRAVGGRAGANEDLCQRLFTDG